MTIEASFERIAVALERLVELADDDKPPVDGAAPAVAPKAQRGRPRKPTVTPEEKATATEAEVVEKNPTSSGATTATAAAGSTESPTSAPAIAPSAKHTIETLRSAVQAYRGRKYPGDADATGKVQEEIFKLVGTRLLKEIKLEDYPKVLEAIK